MAQIEQKLYVFAHLNGEWVPCGQLTLIEEGVRLLASRFAYGLRYLERMGALEIDPVTLGLKDIAAVRGRHLHPANGLAFFGSIRDAAPGAWGRKVIESKLEVPRGSLSESTYLLQAGGQRAGALAVRTTLNAAVTPGPGDWNNLQHLAEGAARIDEDLPVPEALHAILHLGTALGGRRPKASVRDKQGVLWLAKFESRADTSDVPAIEHAALRLAAEAGMNVPPTRRLNVDGRSVMLIRRFDRYWSARTDASLQQLPRDLLENSPGPDRVEKRLAFISAQTLLGCAETDSPSPSYGQIARAIRRHCHSDVVLTDNRELFSRMIYNIFVSNDDDHLRNQGFLWDPRLPGWRLSPLYDVVPRPSPVLERQLHLGVGPEGRAATLDNAFAARELFTLTAGDAAAAVAEVWEKTREWKTYFEGCGVTDEQVEKVEPAFRHMDEVSSAALRRQLP
jgi:serine/threonine-protein kinase HipA